MRDGLTPDDLRFTPPSLSVYVLSPFLQDRWGIGGEFLRLSGERDQNFRLTTADGMQYVLKVSSPLEDPLLVDFQTRALLRIEQVDPGVPVPRIVRSKRGHVSETLIDEGGDAYLVRVLSYLRGVPFGLFGAPSLETVSQIGALQGRMCRALQSFEHEAASHFMPWDILNGLVVTRDLRTRYLEGDLARQCAPLLDRLEQDSLPRMLRLPHQVIHNDAHAGNVIVDQDQMDRVTGIIDFGDLVYRPVVVDLSTSLASILERTATPFPAVAALVKGFRRHMPISTNQLELLYDAVVARAILTVQLLQFRLENTEAGSNVRDGELPNSKVGLRRVLSLDEQAFHEAVLRPEKAFATTG